MKALAAVLALILSAAFIAGASGVSSIEPGNNENIPGQTMESPGQATLDYNFDVSPRIPEDGQKPQSEDWELLLVNPWNTIPEGFDVTLTQLINGQSVDERCYPDLQLMMDDCRAAGLNPLICSSYRSWDTQSGLFENKVSRVMAQGYGEAEARIEAGKVVAVPGTSEHQLGLAVDIVDIENQNLDSSQEQTQVQQWLMSNSWKYGFILRYPADKSEITGISYEPWHYRYVGRDAAEYIYENGICLEEYLELA